MFKNRVDVIPDQPVVIHVAANEVGCRTTTDEHPTPANGPSKDDKVAGFYKTFSLRPGHLSPLGVGQRLRDQCIAPHRQDSPTKLSPLLLLPVPGHTHPIRASSADW